MKNRVILSLIVAFFLVGGAFLLKLNQSGKTTPEKSDVSIIIDNTVKKALAEDSDGDGLKDWEESIRKTDPNLLDTDGDGTNDGDEVNEGRNPLVSGPHDKEETAETEENALPKKKPTATDLFSREIFAQYLEAKKNGQEISADLEAQIAEAVLSQDYEGEVAYFDKKNLLTAKNKDIFSLKTYGNILGSILTTPPVPNIPNEIGILEDIQIRGLTEEHMEDSKLLVARYNNILSKLTSVTVPEETADFHIQIIRGVEVLRDTAEAIQMLEKDPIGSLPKIARYEEGLDLLTAGTINVKRYFVEKSITFSQNEAGYIIFE